MSPSPRFCSTPNPYPCSTPNPYLDPQPDPAPEEAFTPNPYLDSEPNPEQSPVVNSTLICESLTLEELVLLVKNIKNLSKSDQQNLLDHIRKLERENPSLVREIRNAM